MSTVHVQIPDKMTIGTAPYESTTTIPVIMGPPLTDRMITHLDRALRGWSLEQRLCQLAEINPEAAQVYDLSRIHREPQTIATMLGVSVRTVQRRLAAARTFLLPKAETLAEGETYQMRLDRLQVEDRLAHTVHLMVSYRWRHGHIADQLNLSVDQVDRLAAKAREIVGDPDWRAVRHLYATELEVA